jgi:tRNA threonylcarbamoyl adenosine modification protein (Sua5/YciO/YrdC/YwlC family)
MRRGGLVVFPTETVYGIGARADDLAVVGKLRHAKERNDAKPFTIHVGRRQEAHRYVPAISALGQRLIRKGWPGPLTLLFSVPDPAKAPIFEQIERAPAEALYHDGIVGLRCPDDERARDLLNEVGAPVVAASANRAGQPAPSTCEAALDALPGGVDLALDGGRCRLSTPSTIVRLNETGFSVVRAGTYDQRALDRMAQMNLLFVCTGNTCRSPMAAGLCEHLLRERLGGQREALSDHNLSVLSAGVFAMNGSPASEQAVTVMAQRNIDISAHRSQALSTELIHQADHIFVMTPSHLEQVVRMAPAVKDRCRLLCEDQVEDPIGGTVDVYKTCASQIEAGLRARLEELPL